MLKLIAFFCFYANPDTPVAAPMQQSAKVYVSMEHLNAISDSVEASNKKWEEIELLIKQRKPKP